MIYAESSQWIWATPDPSTGHCPAGFGYNSWGCYKRKALGEASISERTGVWLGVAGLLLSAGIMVAMGFHKPTHRRRSYARR